MSLLHSWFLSRLLPSGTKAWETLLVKMEAKEPLSTYVLSVSTLPKFSSRPTLALSVLLM